MIGLARNNSSELFTKNFKLKWQHAVRDQPDYAYYANPFCTFWTSEKAYIICNIITIGDFFLVAFPGLECTVRNREYWCACGMCLLIEIWMNGSILKTSLLCTHQSSRSFCMDCRMHHLGFEFHGMHHLCFGYSTLWQFTDKMFPFILNLKIKTTKNSL